MVQLARHKRVMRTITEPKLKERVPLLLYVAISLHILAFKSIPAGCSRSTTHVYISEAGVIPVPHMFNLNDTYIQILIVM